MMWEWECTLFRIEKRFPTIGWHSCHPLRYGLNFWFGTGTISTLPRGQRSNVIVRGQPTQVQLNYISKLSPRRDSHWIDSALAYFASLRQAGIYWFMYVQYQPELHCFAALIRGTLTCTPLGRAMLRTEGGRENGHRVQRAIAAHGIL